VSPKCHRNQIMAPFSDGTIDSTASQRACLLPIHPPSHATLCTYTQRKKINQTQRKRNNPLLSSKAGPEARPKPSSMERFQTGDRHAPDVQNARCAMQCNRKKVIESLWDQTCVRSKIIRPGYRSVRQADHAKPNVIRFSFRCAFSIRA